MMGTLRRSSPPPPSPAPSKYAAVVSLELSDEPPATRTAGRWLHLRTMLCLAAVLLCLTQGALATPVFVDNPSLAQFQSGRNIRHLPCIVRKSGRSGICMFAIDCIKQNGTHLGTCIDRFYFGSCCQMKEEAPPQFAQEISDNSIDQNTISHFAHESTTLPTSALFKLTTEGGAHHSHPISSDSINETLRNVTQSYLSNKIGSPAAVAATPSSTSGLLSSTTTPRTTAAAVSGDKESSSKRPPVQSTHKTSQFVVRTTAKTPPTVSPTTVKPPKRRTTTKSTTPKSTTTKPTTTTTTKATTTKTTPTTTTTTTTTTSTTTTTKTTPKTTTTSRPVLTTDAPAKLQQTEERIESTTPLTKFFTFQIVETTTATATEPTLAATRRPSAKPRPPTTAAQPTTTTAAAEHTTRPRPLVTRRPEITKKPAPSKRPSAKPTRRPVDTEATVEKIEPPSQANATSTSHRPQPASTASPTTTAQVHAELTAAPPQTTRAPRPKPKPTAEIVKVPKPVSSGPTTTPSKAPSSAATTRKPKPPTTSASSSSSSTTSHRPRPTATVTKTKPASTTTPAAASTATATSPSSTAASTARPSTLTTAPPKVEGTTLPADQLKPGLITWTDVDAEPALNVSGGALGWQPRPPAAADWVPVPTIAPLPFNKTAADTGERTTETAVASTTERIVISVSSSISEVMGNASSMGPKPHRPTVATTKVPKPKPKPKPTKTTTTSTTSAAPSVPASTSGPTTSPSTNTEAPVDVESSTDATSMATGESEAATGSSSAESSTDDYNGSGEMTTLAPTNSLEGMDYKQICGRRMFPEPRIVGGSNAAFGRWPWQISLRQWRTSTYLHKCGAALLNENWAITAAHCVDNVPPSDLLLRLGEYDLAEEEEPYGYQERRVQIVASHPQFDPRTFEYDLALLRFYEPVVFQPNIIPVCVPDSDQDFIGQTAFVTGWGRLYEDGPLPSVLQEVAVPVINNTICESMYRAAGYIELIPHIFICAGWKKGGYDSCEGDSGGPMVLQREDDKRFQLGGVISWGIGCAEANQPGVYTRISEFRDWINQILQF